MDWIKDYIWVIPFSPFVGFLIAGVNAFSQDKILKGASRKIIMITSPLAVFISFVFAVIAFIQLYGMEPEQRLMVNTVYSWLVTGNLVANAAFTIDPLSMVMSLVVTGVGFLIHVYSVGYMADDKSFTRYFAYLNLFTFSMLLLVLGDNILLLFIGWEGVGLCSYLLIGFWFSGRDNAMAGMKAFIVNRIGDFGFIIGIFLLFWGMLYYSNATTVSFREMKALAENLPDWYVTAIVVSLFIGATGKSAQIPLYVWLPDAMAGPTPVSALIHAATMVTAGVYMIGRLSFLFTMSPLGLTIVSIIAVLTAFFAATVGLTQYDIKKVLAYSTVSQLGYMFLGMGVGAYSAGIFHLMTHAFFKGLLFLGSGSVILAMHHEQDMRKMGGLRKKIPITFYTFLMGTIAIAGVPGFAGFFSKDEILWKAFSNPNHIIPWLPYALWIIGVITAGMTAFYMFRLVFMTFFGEYRGDHHTWEHMHESPKSMTIPLILLALLSIFGGYLGVPEALGGSNIIHHWLEPVLFEPEVHGHHSHALEYTLMGISIMIAFLGIFMAYYMYVLKKDLPAKVVRAIPNLHSLVYDKYRVDEFYQKYIVDSLLSLQRGLRWFDIHIVDGFVNYVATVMKFFSQLQGNLDKYYVDGAVNGIAAVVQRSGKVVRLMQTGLTNQYFFYAIGGFLMLYFVKIMFL